MPHRQRRCNTSSVHPSTEKFMQSIRHVALIAALSVAPIFEIQSQLAPPRPPFAPALPRDARSGSPFERRDDRSGPRFGVAYLTNGSGTDELAGRRGTVAA